MSERISVLIADDNMEFGNLMTEFLQQYEDISVTGVARDGIMAVELIREQLPDVVVLDIIMPNLDGLGVLERLSAMNLRKKPAILVLSAIGQDKFIQRAMELGAELYILKPFDINILVSRIRQLYEEKPHISLLRGREKPRLPEKPESLAKRTDIPKRSNCPEVLATELMQKAGILPHIGGYQYLRDAVVLAVERSMVYNSIMKTLYPQIAVKYNTTPRKVERSIRCAIYNAWDRGLEDDNTNNNEIFLSIGKVKPTNSQFINALAGMVRKELDRQPKKA